LSRALGLGVDAGDAQREPSRASAEIGEPAALVGRLLRPAIFGSDVRGSADELVLVRFELGLLGVFDWVNRRRAEELGPGFGVMYMSAPPCWTEAPRMPQR